MPALSPEVGTHLLKATRSQDLDEAFEKALLNEGKVRIHFQCKPRMFQSVQKAGRLLDFLILTTHQR